MTMSSSGKRSLSERWQTLLADPALAAYEELVGRYRSQDRHYHTLEHLAAMFEVCDGLDLPEAKEPALHLAVWYHDAVYDSRAADNEERSAELAREQLGALRLPADLIAETARLILLTKRHLTTVEDRLGQLLLDLDLAVLGAEPTVYDQYATAIRQEYARVAEDAYRQGRNAVLQRFLQRPRIYLTALLHESRERQARLNLGRERTALL